ncbi:MAG: hypothetical protein GY930_16070 [bacterium]|nr:hypothetical protein [bacterium]
MLRPLIAPLLLTAICGCRGGYAPLSNPGQPSVGVGGGSQPAIAVESWTQDLETAQDGPVAKPAPVEKAADPDDWIPVEQVSGKLVETVRSYYPSGHVRRIYSQLLGTFGPLGHHGRDLHLHANGVVIQEAFWVEGVLQGPYREWHESGQLKVESEFKSGKRDGIYMEYGTRGKLRVRGEYTAGSLHGEFSQWFGTGGSQEVSHWEQGIKNGTCQVWDRGMTPVSLETYLNGSRHGDATMYHRIAGITKVHQRGKYHHGLKQGVWVEFNPEGERVQEKEFVRGKVTGYYKEWRGGVLTLDTNYLDSVENGARLEFYASGRPYSRGEMKDGGRKGPWIYWGEDGSVQDTWSGFYAGGKKARGLNAEELKGEGFENE